MRIGEIYKLLCRLYDKNLGLDIEHYLLAEGHFAGCESVGTRLSTREALIIRQRGDDLELGLFIDPGIMATLENRQALDHIDEFSCVAEGASHFLYVTDRAAKERKVSKLELELQGEVDKFLVIHLYASKQSSSVPPSLFAQQFERHSFNTHLTPEETERYETASHFAAKYCSHLRAMYFNPLRLLGLLPRARDFFERDLAGKMKILIP